MLPRSNSGFVCFQANFGLVRKLSERLHGDVFMAGFPSLWIRRTCWSSMHGFVARVPLGTLQKGVLFGSNTKQEMAGRKKPAHVIGFQQLWQTKAGLYCFLKMPSCGKPNDVRR